jgi:hypothetical protein
MYRRSAFGGEPTRNLPACLRSRRRWNRSRTGAPEWQDQQDKDARKEKHVEQAIKICRDCQSGMKFA